MNGTPSVSRNEGEMRIPIFPIGITYSVPSGADLEQKFW